nr:hypothetical protein [Peptoniphilus sp.]
MIYLEDRVCYITTFDRDEQSESLISFDIPYHVIDDGRIEDPSQLQYLLRQQLEKAGLLKSTCLFIVNTTDAVSRAMHVPTMTQKEIESLVENESPNLFVQDLDDYRLEYVDFETGEDMHHLLITICAEDLLQGYFDLASEMKIKLEGVIPFSTLLIQHAHRLGGGRIGLMSSSHLGFYYANENRYYSRSEDNEAVRELMERYRIEFSHLGRLYKGQYDERLVEIDRDAFQRDLEASFFDALSHIENMGADFALEDRKLLTGSMAESGLYDMLTSSRMYAVLPLRDVFSVAYDNREVLKTFQKKERRKTGKGYLLPVIAVVAAFAILIGTFVYGEKLKQENKRLIVESTKREERENIEKNAPARENEDIAELISTVKSSVPDELSVTGINYEDGMLTISGEGNDAAAIETWRGELETTLGKDVTQEPSATIGDTVYFQLSVALNPSSQDTSDAPEHPSMDEGIQDQTNIAPSNDGDGDSI